MALCPSPQRRILRSGELPGIREILATVASELCKSCNEAEIPHATKPNPRPVRVPH